MNAAVQARFHFGICIYLLYHIIYCSQVQQDMSCNEEAEEAAGVDPAHFPNNRLILSRAQAERCKGQDSCWEAVYSPQAELSSWLIMQAMEAGSTTSSDRWSSM